VRAAVRLVFVGLASRPGGDSRGHEPCSWCSLIADLEAGEPVTVSGGQAWEAMVAQPLTPTGAFAHLRHDVRRYRVVGPDTLEAA